MSAADPRAALLREAMGLKAVDRAGWLRVGVGAPESVAAHAWGVALLALATCPPELDLPAVLRMALVHDLPEVRVGDLTPHDGVPREEKRRREAEAAAALLAPWPELLAAWEEYDRGASPEARFVHQLDRLDLGLQARRYAAEGHAVEELLESARRGVQDPALRALLDRA
jgi:putative hydrolases of HD superfamily